MVTRIELKALLGLSAALARGGQDDLARAMERCLSSADPGRTEEVILQSYLFLGYPTALNAFSKWRELSGLEAGAPGRDAWEDWIERGREVCRTVYGGQYEGLRLNVRALHPDMERWMVVEGYGKVLGRPGLALVVRELCIVALLAGAGAPRQLHSHLRGALNSGAGGEELEEALATAETYLGEEERAEVRGVWDQVRGRWLEASREMAPGNGSRFPGTPRGRTGEGN
jgi:4-carboxymuconolactone decarboxylase